MTKANRSRLLTALGVVAVAALAWFSLPKPAQAVRFEGIPTSNTCGYPWVMTLVGCGPATPWIAPGDSATLDCTTNLIQTPQGYDFASPPGVVIQPGNTCFFHQCGAASLTLSCGSIGGDDRPVYKQNQNIQFKRVKVKAKAKD